MSEKRDGRLSGEFCYSNGRPAELRRVDECHLPCVEASIRERPATSVERIVPKREKEHVVVNGESLVRRTDADGNARERG
jgi:uncharacterized protein YfaP (DUF2135 family)